MALKEPTEAPQTFYSEFSLPPVRFLKATVEDCDEDDCDSILGAGHDDISSIHSITSDKTDISSDHSVHHNRPSNGDIPNGQMRMVPSMLMAKQALADMTILLRRKSKGKGGGYHAPKLDLGNVTGYPGVFQSNPHPYLSKPAPASMGAGFHGYG